MIDPQENITIGNFLYALGLCVGFRAANAGLGAPVAAINLLQQTSYDGALGDVMLYYSGVTRLLEFKRSNNPTKERGKHRQLSAAISSSATQTRTSRAIHWIVVTSSAEPLFNTDALPYLDWGNSQGAVPQDLKQLVDEIASEALGSTSAVSDQLVHRYIQDIILTWGCSGRGHSSTGLLVTVDGGGGMRYVVVEDLADLARTPQACRQLEQQRQQEIQAVLSRLEESRQQQAILTLREQAKQVKGRSRGLGLSL